MSLDKTKYLEASNAKAIEIDGFPYIEISFKTEDGNVHGPFFIEPRHARQHSDDILKAVAGTMKRENGATVIPEGA